MSCGVALRLGRVSNLPTVWTNTVAGLVLAGAPVKLASTTLLIASLSLFYIGGMYLNDAFDRDVDARERPRRPIPSGEVRAATVFAAGFVMLGLGEALLAIVGYGFEGGQRWRPLASGCGLAATIVYYDARHKSDPLSPVVMGLCRALAYVTAGVAMAPRPADPVFWGSGLLLAYVIGLTYAAKQENLTEIQNLWPLACVAAPFIYGVSSALDGATSTVIYAASLAWVVHAVLKLVRRDRTDIPGAVVRLIAGISFIDAFLIASHGRTHVAWLAALCVALTRLLQRSIPGT